MSGRLFPEAIMPRISRSRSVRTGESLARRTRISVTSPAVTAGAGEHGVDDLVPLRLFREVAGRAGLERLVDEPAVGEGGEQQHLRLQAVARDGVDDRHAVELRELVVDQRDVGRVLADLVEC